MADRGGLKLVGFIFATVTVRDADGNDGREGYADGVYHWNDRRRQRYQTLLTMLARLAARKNLVLQTSASAVTAGTAADKADHQRAQRGGGRTHGTDWRFRLNGFDRHAVLKTLHVHLDERRRRSAVMRDDFYPHRNRRAAESQRGGDLPSSVVKYANQLLAGRRRVRFHC